MYKGWAKATGSAEPVASTIHPPMVLNCLLTCSITLDRHYVKIGYICMSTIFFLILKGICKYLDKNFVLSLSFLLKTLQPLFWLHHFSGKLKQVSIQIWHLKKEKSHYPIIASMVLKENPNWNYLALIL